MVVWGDSDALDPVDGLNNVIAIAAGRGSRLSRPLGTANASNWPGARKPVSTPRGFDDFISQGEGLGAVQYQWLFDGTNIGGATNATLTLTNVQAGQKGITR